MIFTFITALIFFIVIAAGIAILAFNYANKKKRSGGKTVHAAIPACLIIAGLLLLVLIPGSFHTVEAGTVAVVKQMGVIAEVESPGTYFDFWLIRKYEIYDSKVQ
ncbi:MAG: hypothetical protein ACI4QL_05590 [Candidatus Fimimonas sp.]